MGGDFVIFNLRWGRYRILNIFSLKIILKVKGSNCEKTIGRVVRVFVIFESSYILLLM